MALTLCTTLEFVFNLLNICFLCQSMKNTENKLLTIKAFHNKNASVYFTGCKRNKTNQI